MGCVLQNWGEAPLNQSKRLISAWFRFASRKGLLALPQVDPPNTQVGSSLLCWFGPFELKRRKRDCPTPFGPSPESAARLFQLRLARHGAGTRVGEATVAAGEVQRGEAGRPGAKKLLHGFGNGLVHVLDTTGLSTVSRVPMIYIYNYIYPSIYLSIYLSINLSYPILSYPILSYPILSYPILSYPILSIYLSIYVILLCILAAAQNLAEFVEFW